MCYRSDSETIETQRDTQSVEELCKRFLSLCEANGSQLINVGECAKRVETECHKVMGIADVLTGLGSMKRRSEGLYQWEGLRCMAVAVAQLEVALQAMG